MPELPEVETIARDLSERVVGKVIRECRILREIVVRGDSTEFRDSLRDQPIKEIVRRGKYLVLRLDSADLVAHLRMTGKFIFVPSDPKPQSHNRVLFLFSDQSSLIFNDVRCFGTLELVERWDTHPSIRNLGLEPFDPEMSVEYLRNQLERRNTSMKNFLMNQEIIAGLGNIYVSEILFDSGISPLRNSKTLKRAKINRLLRSMQRILTAAIQKNGTSISDFRRVDEKTGEFQSFLKVYGKTGDLCPKCGTEISKTVISQRSTFFCSRCQK